jgi:hypothetical protein
VQAREGEERVVGEKNSRVRKLMLAKGPDEAFGLAQRLPNPMDLYGPWRRNRRFENAMVFAPSPIGFLYGCPSIENFAVLV